MEEKATEENMNPFTTGRTMGPYLDTDTFF